MRRHVRALRAGLASLACVAIGLTLLASAGLVTAFALLVPVQILAGDIASALGADVRWTKGSTWAVEHHKGRFTKAMYLRPPD